MKISALLLILFFTFLAGCSDASSSKVKNTKPVVWFSTFSMPNMLSSSFKIQEFNDIRKMLTIKWYGGFSIVKAAKPDNVIHISTCQNYFSFKGEEIYTTPEINNSALMYIAVLCEATQVIANGKPSKKSFLDTIIFNKHLPEQLPPQMAQIISTMESKRILANKKITSWAQVDPILKTEKLSPNRVKYFIDGGSEELQLLAKGDFNHDGIEDMLIQINDAVEGGTYSATRLFLLTRLTSNGQIKLLQQWPKE